MAYNNPVVKQNWRNKMGAQVFMTKAVGGSAKEAFNEAIEEAYYNHGHAGYTGEICEKDSFVMIPLPEGMVAEEYADTLIDKCDKRVDDKWGPAGCIQTGETEFLFFGWASC
jgi:hypothetical protein